MKLSVLMTLACLALVACKGNEVSRLPVPKVDPIRTTPNTPTDNQNPTPVVLKPDFVLREAYWGSSLNLQFPDDQARGTWTLRGADAQQMFETLRVQAGSLDGNDTWMDGQFKAGASTTCYKQAYRSKPDEWMYSCIVNVNYHTGVVVPLLPVEQVLIDEAAPQVSGHEGTDLVIDEELKVATYTIRHNDAMALYASLRLLEAEETDGNGDNYRVRRHQVVCKLELPDETASCSVTLNAENGALIQ